MIDLGLQRISRLLQDTALPWRAIHVAGTNGKGSVCAYVSRMLDVYNKSELPEARELPPIRHGRFTSPHLVDRWDCITIDSKPVASQLFLETEKLVLARNAHNNVQSSEFELLTATAFELFSRQKLDVAVVEVGMGGRLDSTNIIGQHDYSPPNGLTVSKFRPEPLVSVITQIGLDHQQFLGDTLEAIAREKAGIIKPGVPVVFDDTNDSNVTAAFRGVAKRNGSDAISGTNFDIIETILKSTANSADQSPYEHNPSRRINASFKSLPHHTKTNLTLAFNATWLALDRFLAPQTSFFSHPPSTNPSAATLATSMLKAAITTSFPGRQQQLNITTITGRTNPILLDGAHNAQSAEALSKVVPRPSSPISQQQQSGVTWVLAMSDSKDATEVLRPLLKPGDRVFVVEFGPVDGMPWVRAMPCEALSAVAKRVIADRQSAPPSSSEEIEVTSCGTDVRGALKAASQAAHEGPMVVAGSLYLVGDVLRLLREASGASWTDVYNHPMNNVIKP